MALVTAARITKPRRYGNVKSWMNDPEVHLMLLAQREDAAAFTELVNRYWSQVFGQVYRRLGDREAVVILE